MASGDKRWAAPRKSGMTVLGKVPKPINLPSQRSENHGLDPTVEIVPKGTFTWGSRLPSTTSPNAWASSSVQSPNADGHAGSPINAHPSSGGGGTRPSSGGSGPRPSTSGSDKSHEAASNPWGPNSRPSSSSGISPSNQSSLAASRPRSAETRPGSSHLSRFAENATDNAIAWASTKVADKLGTASIRNDNFILSSGDFPTLGFEKTPELRGHSSQGRPSSGSSGHTIQKEMHDSSPSYGKESAHSDNNNDDSWKLNNQPYVAGSPMNIDRWESNMPHVLPYPSFNLAPQHFEPWHGPPVHTPEGIWYRGAQPGGPYRPPGPPGSYPIEPFPYYSQLPLGPSNSQGVPPGSASGAYHHKNLDPYNSHGSHDSSNSQAVHRTGAGPGGFCPQNLEPYGAHRPHDSYVVPAHPGIHFRPGSYGPPVAYDSYYRPPAIIHHSSEREVHTREPAVQFAVIEKFHQNDDNDAGNCPAQPGLFDHFAPKDESDQAQGPHPTHYKVLLKQRDSQPACDAHEKRWHPEVQSSSHLDRENLQEDYLLKDNQQTNTKMDEKFERLTGTKYVQTMKTSTHIASALEGHSPCHVAMDAPQNKGNPAVHDRLKKHVPFTVASHEQDQCPVNKKNILIEKIEGLNNKARLVDSPSETEKFLSKEHAKNSMTIDVKESCSIQTVSTSATSPGNQSSAGTLSAGRDSGLDSKRKLSSSWRTISVQSGTQDFVTSMLECPEGIEGYTRGQRKANGAGNHTNSRFRNQDEESVGASGISSSAVTEATSTYRPDISLSENYSSQLVCEMQDSDNVANISGPSLAECSSDSGGSKAQRVKLKEIAAERARQLQRQEEERTREQKAKALAKLEELNRRTLSQGSNPCLSSTMLPSNKAQSHNDGHVKTCKPDNPVREVAESLSTQDSLTMNPQDESETGNLDELTCHLTKVGLEASDSDIQQRPVACRQFLPVSQGNVPEYALQKTELCSHDIGASKVRQIGYKKRQCILQEKNAGDKQIPLDHVGSPKNFTGNPSHSISGLFSNEESTSQHKKKNNKGSRNKNKLDNAPSSPTSTKYDEKPQECQGAMGSGKSHHQALELESAFYSCVSDSMEKGSTEADAVASYLGSPPVKENVHARGGNNHWNNQSHKRTPRNHQAARPADRLHSGDTVIWAPVKPSGRSLQGPDERSSEDSNNKNDLDSQNILKTKRAEIERYVPKHVVRETPQHNSQQPSLSTNEGHVITSEKPVSGAKGPETGKIALMVGKLDIQENRPSRHGKLHASWRQRNSGGPSSILHSNEGSVSSEPTKSVQVFPDQQPFYKPDKSANLVTDGECRITSNNVVLDESVTPVTIKDQMTISKGKRQNMKAHKFGGNNYSSAISKDGKSASVDKNGNLSETFDLNISNRGSSRSENKNSNEPARPQWQPKTQVHFCNPKLGNINDDVQKQISQDAEFAKNLLSPQMDDFPMQLDSNNALKGKKSIPHEEFMAESRAPFGTPVDHRSSYKQNKFPLGTTDEQSNFHALHHHGQHHGRFNRGHEANCKIKDHGPDRGKQKFQIDAEISKNSLHCEYQKIDTFNNSVDQSQFCDGTHSDSRSHGSRYYRERNHNHTRRGSHLYGRGSNTVRVGDYYNNDE